ncbi:MAG: helix-turn-helix transcriptional regulator [Candidatus Kaiserbacteria bacterium]|nr:helix-turn-helix transcriptional regulator [Candidatus Kaiserbacteria bacterium]
MDISAKFGNRVRAIRLKKEMSQGDVAKLLDVHRTYISKIERGIENMSLQRIEKLAKALKVEIKDLVK